MTTIGIRARVIGAFVLVVAASGAVGAQPLDGDDFYLPPSPLPRAEHGAVIRSRPLSNSAALPGAARNLLVLYHSRSIDGRDIAVSGTLAIPAGEPPAGGWPLCARGNNLSYTVYPGATHETIVSAAAAQIRSFVDARFAGEVAQGNCGSLPRAAAR